MSLSSVAQESALRLGSAPQRADVIMETAARVAADAATHEGMSADDAAKKGTEAAEQARAEGSGQVTSVASGPLAQLVKYIPTETISLYIAVLAALGDVSVPEGGATSDADFSSRWAWLWVLAAATLLLTLGLSYRAQKDANQAAGFRWPLFDLAAAVAAFLIWALSLPTTPLRDIDGFDYSAWNSVIILAGTIAIATAAYVLGKNVSWQKVVEAD